MSARKRVVFDTGVFIAAAIKPDGSTRALVERWDRDDEFDVLWSQKLAYELHQTLYSKSAISNLVSEEHKAYFFNRLEQRATLVDDVKLDNPLPLAHDRNDDYLVALAYRNNAILVTTDSKVLRAIEESELNVQAMHPSHFVQELNRERHATDDLVDDKTEREVSRKGDDDEYDY